MRSTSSRPSLTTTAGASGASLMSGTSAAMAAYLAARPSDREKDRRCSNDCWRPIASWAE
jgi:hypothetical protein